MKIESIRIENFRCFKDETIQFDNYTCLIGGNGAGKSTVINALNVFFRQKKDCQTDMGVLCKDDFHHQVTSNPIRITITFIDLSQEAKDKLKDYFRNGKLIISAVATFDESLNRAEVIQHGIRRGIEDFKIFFENEKNKMSVVDLRTCYNKIRENYPDLPAEATKEAMKDALRKYESEHDDKCSEIHSQDQFYGVSKGADRLSKFIQWVYVSATKDATKETEENKTTALGQLLERTVRSKVKFTEKINELKKQTQLSYKTIVDAEQQTLNDISESLRKRLELWSHPGITARVLWKEDSEKNVRVEEPFAFVKIGEKNFEGELARFGHGLQRSFLLALLQELSSINESSEPTLIMGIEEPELYQHPPQAKYLSEILQELTKKDSQIFICTHSPLFVPGDNISSIRLIKEKGTSCTSYSKSCGYEELAIKLKNVNNNTILKEEGMLAKLYPTLNPIINEMFFCSKLILVEGLEDVAYIMTYLDLLKKSELFRKMGAHIVPVGGKSNIIKPIAIAQILEIPFFVLFDSDNNETDSTKIINHKKDNKDILQLTNNYSNNEWAEDTQYLNNLVMLKSNITEIIKSELGVHYNKYKDLAEKRYGQPGGLQKNQLAIAYMMEKAFSDGVKSQSLEKIIQKIDSFLNA